MSTPDEPLRNDALDQLKQDLREKGVDGLITPDEVVFQQISDPEPTDAIGEAEGPAEPDPAKDPDRA